MNKKIHPLTTNPTYVLYSSIRTNGISSWQVEMDKVLPCCSTRPAFGEFVFNLIFLSLKWRAHIIWIALKGINSFFLHETLLWRTSHPWKKKKNLNGSKKQIAEHELWFIQSSIGESVLQSELKMESLEPNLLLSFKDKTTNQYLFTYGLSYYTLCRGSAFTHTLLRLICSCSDFV